MLDIAKNEKGAVLRVIYSSSGNGSNFSKNHHSCFCQIEVAYWIGDKYMQAASWSISGHRNQAACYKAARKFIRENNLRKTWETFLPQ